MFWLLFASYNKYFSYVILGFGKFFVLEIPRHKSDRCRRTCLSQSGHRNLCYLKQTLRLWSLASSRERKPALDSVLIPLDVDGVLFPRARFPPGPLASRGARMEIWQKKDEIVMKCQLNVYFPQTLLECSISRYKTIFSKIF